MAIIEIYDIYKVYKIGDVEVNALNGISLKIDRGEFVSIMGASGSGKSTFMNILGCLDVSTRGKYLLHGDDVSKLDKDKLAEIRNKELGFVFQSYNLLPRTTAIENVELPLIYSSVSLNKNEIYERCRHLLESVGLGKKINNEPTQLSGGEQQRVAIARALVNNPSVILADEPTGNLDSKTSVEIMENFVELNKSKKITIILVTHESDIAKYSNRKILFKDGEIIEDTANQDNQ